MHAMKRQILIIYVLFMCISCENTGEEKVRLLEFEVNGQIVSYEGYAKCYNEMKNKKSIGNDWHIYNIGKNVLDIRIYDSTLTRKVFAYPTFNIEYIIKQTAGLSKTYQPTDGEFRFLGPKEGDVTGDFYFKMKNISDPDDSIMINNGYFRIWLEKIDRILY